MAIMNFFGFHEGSTLPSTGKEFGVIQNITLTLEVSGDATGLIIIPEGIVNYKTTTWSPLSLIALEDFTISNSITKNGIYSLDITGLCKIRFNLTAIISGAVNIVARVSA